MICSKKIVCVILICVLLVACQTDVKEDDKKLTLNEKDIVLEQDFGEAVPFDIRTYHYGKMDVEEIQSWGELIYEKYDVKITLKDGGVFTQKFDGYMQAYCVKDDSVNGFVFVPNTAKIYLDNFIEDNSILPLNEYVKDNETWNNLPLMMQDMYKDEKGNIWAIPYGFEPTFGARYINKEWLEDSQLPLPETLNDLLEVAANFSNRSSNEYFTSVGDYKPIKGLIDIFNANGCYITYGDINCVSSSVSFDPETETFEDSMLKPEMRDTLLYIMNMVQSEYIYVKKALDKEIIVGSKYNPTVNRFNSSVYSFIYSLKGTRTYNTMPVYINKLTGFYVLTKNSENPNYVVNQFLDIFYGDKDGHFIGKYGIPGEYYEIDHNTVLLNMHEYNMKNEFLQPVVGEFESFASDNIQYEYSNMTYEDSIAYSDYKKKVYSFIDDKVDTTEAFLALPKYTNLSFLLDMLVGAVDEMNTFDNSMTTMLKHNINVDDVIAEYRSIAKTYKGQEKLDEMNKKIGTSSIFDY